MAEQIKKRESERTLYFDILRIIATFAVIILHAAAQNWHSTDVRSFEWNAFNVWDSVVCWSVPVFVMISGAIFLNPNYKINLKKIYTKNIF